MASASSCLASAENFLLSVSSASFILSKIAAGKKESTATKIFLGNLIANSTVPWLSDFIFALGTYWLGANKSFKREAKENSAAVPNFLTLEKILVRLD